MAKNILVIDDDSQVLISLEHLFQKSGYSVATAKGGKEALQLIADRDFDLVVIDIRMPELDGVETVNKIKECRRNQNKVDIPIIFITGYADVDANAKAEELGEVVLKPFDLEDLLNRVKQQTVKRRVVITGLGVIAPNGIGKEEFWLANVNGKSGVKKIEGFDTSAYGVKIAGEIVNFDPLHYMSDAVVRRTDRYAQLGFAAAKMAVEDSRLNIDQENKFKIGVCIGTGLGGMLFHEEQIARVMEKGPAGAHPLGVPKISPNAVPGHIAIELGLKGINLAISTACASSTNAIGQAFDIIRLKRADVVISGGAEAPITPVTIACYDSLKVLSTKRNANPSEASRPFDLDRDGFVIGEGAGMLILEELEHALRRGAHIYAEIIGYGSTSGAYHMVIPDPSGDDAARVMRLAIEEAGIKPEDIDYINAHGTSTKVNDKVETQAIKTILGQHAYKIPISSTKSMIGHLIGAAGAVGLVATVLAIQENTVPPTINYQEKDPDCDLDYVPNEARHIPKLNIAMTNSFGFGSNNAAVIVKKYY
jgi:3-oxoacyl-[acyl-carrier-protein] synthase II